MSDVNWNIVRAAVRKRIVARLAASLLRGDLNQHDIDDMAQEASAYAWLVISTWCENEADEAPPVGIAIHRGAERAVDGWQLARPDSDPQRWECCDYSGSEFYIAKRAQAVRYAETWTTTADGAHEYREFEPVAS